MTGKTHRVSRRTSPQRVSISRKKGEPPSLLEIHPQNSTPLRSCQGIETRNFAGYNLSSGSCWFWLTYRFGRQHVTPRHQVPELSSGEKGGLGVLSCSYSSSFYPREAGRCFCDFALHAKVMTLPVPALREFPGDVAAG